MITVLPSHCEAHTPVPDKELMDWCCLWFWMILAQLFTLMMIEVQSQAACKMQDKPVPHECHKDSLAWMLIKVPKAAHVVKVDLYKSQKDPRGTWEASAC